jgi:fructose-bisphosphate aldolase class I
MASATLLKSSFLPKKAEWGAARQVAAPRVSMVVRAGAYDDELVKTAVRVFCRPPNQFLLFPVIPNSNSPP